MVQRVTLMRSPKVDDAEAVTRRYGGDEFEFEFELHSP